MQCYYGVRAILKVLFPPGLIFLILDIKLEFHLHPVVVLLVPVKIPLQGKCLPAALLLALEWFLSTVSYHVSLQSIFPGESGGTSWFSADEGLFPSLDSPVVRKLKPTMESPFAIWPIASEHTHSCVMIHVSFKFKSTFKLFSHAFDR